MILFTLADFILIFALYVFIFLIRAAFELSDGIEDNYWIFWVMYLLDCWIFLRFVG